MVFGHLLSGQQLIREIEDLTVTEQSRPLTEVHIDNCGELIPQLKKGKECVHIKGRGKLKSFPWLGEAGGQIK